MKATPSAYPELIRIEDDCHNMLGILSQSEAQNLVTSISALIAPQNACNPKETPKEGPSNWVEAATRVIQDAYSLTGEFHDLECSAARKIRNHICNIIDRHARAHLETLNKDDELKKLNEESEEQAQTIALLSQQLADKKEVIRRLTT